MKFIFLAVCFVGVVGMPMPLITKPKTIETDLDQDEEVQTLVNLINESEIAEPLFKEHNPILLETGSEQEIQTIKDYLVQLKTDIRGGAAQYVQDSVGMMEELTTAIKSLKKKIESTVDRVNAKAEAKLLAIKAIEELIGFPEEDSNALLLKATPQHAEEPETSAQIETSKKEKVSDNQELKKEE